MSRDKGRRFGGSSNRLIVCPYPAWPTPLYCDRRIHRTPKVSKYTGRPLVEPWPGLVLETRPKIEGHGRRSIRSSGSKSTRQDRLGASYGWGDFPGIATASIGANGVPAPWKRTHALSAASHLVCQSDAPISDREPSSGCTSGQWTTSAPLGLSMEASTRS